VANRTCPRIVGVCQQLVTGDSSNDRPERSLAFKTVRSPVGVNQRTPTHLTLRGCIKTRSARSCKRCNSYLIRHDRFSSSNQDNETSDRESGTGPRTAGSSSG